MWGLNKAKVLCTIVSFLFLLYRYVIILDGKHAEVLMQTKIKTSPMRNHRLRTKSSHS